MRALHSFLTLGLISIIIFGCKEIPIAISDPVIPDSERVVLLEELTGASCPNCPKGAAAVDNILASYPHKVAVVAIHGEFLAEPIKHRSIYDFRNPKAKDLEHWFKPWYGKPAAATNRIFTGDEFEPYAISSPDIWLSEVEKELQKPHEMNVLVATDYDANSRQLTVDVNAIPLVDLLGNYNISIFLTESGMIDAQSNAGVIIDEFEFKHVLMDMLTKFDGDALATNLVKNQSYKRTYTYTMPVVSGLFDPARMEIVVAVSHSDPSNRSVIQAAHKKVLE